MQHAAHVIDFYSWAARDALMAGDMRDLKHATKRHDTYLIEHDKSVSAFVAAQIGK